MDRYSFDAEREKRQTRPLLWIAIAFVCILFYLLVWPIGANQDAARNIFAPPPPLPMVTYMVEGAADAQAKIIYRERDIAGNVQEYTVEHATLPWTRKVEFTSGQLLAINAIVASGSGPIACKIYRGDPMAQPLIDRQDARAVVCAIVFPDATTTQQVDQD